jgi:SAM-dependent methyltransferase
MRPRTAAGRWSDDLAAWAIPPEILERAPESPWGCPTGLFARSAEDAVGPEAGSAWPSARRARQALPEGGSVLDVGVGGGAASLPLAPPASRITGVDQNPRMLAAFAALADRLGVAHAEVEGNWPDVASSVAPADVVVCHHVVYNVPDLVAFVEALTAKARHRVVVELTADHPQSTLNPLWQQFHGLDRPNRPTAEDAAAVLRELGLDVGREEWEAPSRWMGSDPSELVAFVRRRLCLPPERDPDVAAALGDDLGRGPRPMVTMWWPGTAG